MLRDTQEVHVITLFGKLVAFGRGLGFMVFITIGEGRMGVNISKKILKGLRKRGL
jgi:hypothetical protein